MTPPDSIDHPSFTPFFRGGSSQPTGAAVEPLLKMQMHYPRHNNPEILAHTKTHLLYTCYSFSPCTLLRYRPGAILDALQSDD